MHLQPARTGAGGGPEGPLKILQIHTADAGGGAEKSAVLLNREFSAAGHSAHLLVGRKTGDSDRIHEIEQHQRWRGEYRNMRFTVQGVLVQAFGTYIHRAGMTGLGTSPTAK